MPKDAMVWVAGTPTFSNYRVLCKALDKETGRVLAGRKLVVCTTGEHRVARLADKWARTKKLCHSLTFPVADRSVAARQRRDRELASAAHLLVAFWDGDDDQVEEMIDLCEFADVPHKIILIEDES